MQAGRHRIRINRHERHLLGRRPGQEELTVAEASMLASTLGQQAVGLMEIARVLRGRHYNRGDQTDENRAIVAESDRKSDLAGQLLLCANIDMAMPPETRIFVEET